MATLGIKLTQVIPGPFRTDFIGRSLDQSPRLPDYEASVGKFGGFLSKMDGRQPGDPDKAAAAILDLLNKEKPPFRFVIGAYANSTFAQKISSMEAEMNAWKEKGLPTDFTQGA